MKQRPFRLSMSDGRAERCPIRSSTRRVERAAGRMRRRGAHTRTDPVCATCQPTAAASGANGAPAVKQRPFRLSTSDGRAGPYTRPQSPAENRCPQCVTRLLLIRRQAADSSGLWCLYRRVEYRPRPLTGADEPRGNGHFNRQKSPDHSYAPIKQRQIIMRLGCRVPAGHLPADRPSGCWPVGRLSSSGQRHQEPE